MTENRRQGGQKGTIPCQNLFRRDGTLGKQYKLHITPTERKWWGVKAGDRVEVFETDRGKVASQVCYEVEFPEITRIAVEQGAQIWDCSKVTASPAVC